MIINEYNPHDQIYPDMRAIHLMYGFTIDNVPYLDVFFVTRDMSETISEANQMLDEM